MFDLKTRTTQLIATSFAFTLGLAMNNALQKTFTMVQLPTKKDSTAHAWIYLGFIFPICMLIFYFLSKIQE